MTADILLAHFERYPRLEAQDAMKLIYQMEFGPEHLIRDEKKSLKMLEEEMAALSADAEEALYVPIGNGLCRLNLRACLSRGIEAADINRLLCETAKSVSGDKKRFWQGVRVLQELADADETPFEPVLLDLFLARYPKTCPPMHHSEMYRRFYQPAYRVVSQKRVKDYLSLRRAKEQAGQGENAL